MSDRFAAVQPFYDHSFLGSAHRLLCIGCGRVGWKVAQNVADHGFRQLRLVDCDTISTRNTPYGFPEAAVGRLKVEYAVEELARRRPGLDLGYDRRRLQAEQLGNIVRWVEWSTIVGLFIDDFGVGQGLVQLAYRRRPMVYAGLLGEGAIGESAWSVPGQTPCLSCTVRLAEKQGAHGGSAIPSDVDALVCLTVRQILGLALVGRRGFACFADYVDPQRPVAYVVNRRGGPTEIPAVNCPGGVRLVQVTDGQGDGPSCPVCSGYRP